MRAYINKGMIVVSFYMFALIAFLFALLLSSGETLAVYIIRSCQLFLLIMGFRFMQKATKPSRIVIKFSENEISSHLFFKKCCTVSCEHPVYVSFFSEIFWQVDKYTPRHYVMFSNYPLPDFEQDARFRTYDMSKQIISPDTEKTRQAIAPLLSSKFCVLQGGDPPPVETLRKKKEEPPVVKREKSPDDPPPFTGKWNGRF